MTITEFLTARLDEDEERAGSGWASLRDERWESTNEGQSVMTPRAILADIAAKRAIVEVFEEAARDVDAIDYDYGADDEDWGAVSLLRDVVRLLAQPYSGHPDFDERWRV